MNATFHRTRRASRWGRQAASLLSAGLLCGLLAAGPMAQAQNYLSWTSSSQYDQYSNLGYGGFGAPSISLDSYHGGNVVEVHDGGNGTLWYRTGKFSVASGLTWNNGNSAHQYDHYANFGYGGQGTPSVSLYGNNVVEVHDGGDGTLWYRTGTLLSSGLIAWNNGNTAIQYDHYTNFGNGGVGNPSVSLYGTKVVEVHDGSNGTLWYRTGTLSGGKIIWNNGNSAIQYDHYANFGYGGYGTPSISLSGSTVVEAHDGGDGTLWYRTGTLLSNGQIKWMYWSQYDHYDNFGHGGYGTPSVSFDSNHGGNVVEVHDGGNGILWFKWGQLQANGQIKWLQWGQYSHYDNFGNGGYGNPSVSLSYWGIVEVHDGGSGYLWDDLGYLGWL